VELKERTRETSQLTEYIGVLLRRKTIVLFAAVICPLCAVVLSLGERPIYEASAEVLLSHENPAATLNGGTDPAAYLNPDRVAATQAKLAEVPIVARRTLDAVGLHGRTAQDLLDSSTVAPATNTDLLEFNVRDESAPLARRLATAYARTFTRYRKEVYSASINSARENVESRLRELRAQDLTKSPLYRELAGRERQLGTLGLLETSDAFVVRPADNATKVRPRPLLNGVFGFLLGVALGVGLAFLSETLDTRVRSSDEIVDQLARPLLGRLPPPRGPRHGKGIAMLADPNGRNAEAFRRLRTNLEFTMLEQSSRVVMVTSAFAGEGKSETSANLAVAAALAGKRVVLVDLDLRNPSLDLLLGIETEHGLTDVALGHVALEDVIARVPISAASEQASVAKGNGRVELDGVLKVLPAGPMPPQPGEFAGTHVVAEILERLRDEADLVIIDTPPLLPFGDALTLSRHVDGLVLVIRLDVIRRRALKELRATIDSLPSPTLGVVLTGVGAADLARYERYQTTHRARDERSSRLEPTR
jgi:capsular exopolysaccharide synthesis family protein